MKQVTLSDVIEALKDQPITIGERLEALGLSREELKGKFSKEILETAVYGSSFAKFLQDNADKLAGFDRGIPAKELPPDFKNPFDDENRSVGQRLDELGIKKKDVEAMFGDDVLNLNLTGEEFQDFIAKHQNKFLGQLEKLASKGAKHA